MTRTAVSIRDDAGILLPADQQHIMAAAQAASFGGIVWTTSAYATQDAFVNAVQDLVRTTRRAVIALSPVLQYFYIGVPPDREHVAGTVAQAVSVATAPFSAGQWGGCVVAAITSLAGVGEPAIYSNWPTWVVWMINEEWPIDIVVAFVLWFLLTVLLLVNVGSAPVSPVGVFGVALFIGIGGTSNYLICLAGMKFLERSGCNVSCFLPIVLTIWILFYPVYIISRRVVLPILRERASK